MGLNFLNNEDNNNDKPESNDTNKNGKGMTFEEATQFLTGDLDAHDDDLVREKIGQEGLDNVKAVEKVMDDLTATMKTVLYKKQVGDPSVTLDLYVLAQKTKSAMKSLSEEQVASIIATGIAAVAQIEMWMSDRDEDDDD